MEILLTNAKLKLIQWLLGLTYTAADISWRLYKKLARSGLRLIVYQAKLKQRKGGG